MPLFCEIAGPWRKCRTFASTGLPRCISVRCCVRPPIAQRCISEVLPLITQRCIYVRGPKCSRGGARAVCGAAPPPPLATLRCISALSIDHSHYSLFIPPCGSSTAAGTFEALTAWRSTCLTRSWCTSHNMPRDTLCHVTQYATSHMRRLAHLARRRIL
jgi:hypothetical protein